MRSLQDRTAVITGASSGIGKATALALARAGAAVALVALPGEELTSATTQCSGYGVEAIALPADVSNPSAVADVFERAAELGRIDAVFNNAGVYAAAALVDTTDDQWASMVAVNLTGSFLVFRAAARAMIPNGYGAIVATASELAVIGEARTAAYTATKGGILAMTRAVASELATSGIRVNSVCPGPIDTPLIKDELAAASDVRATLEQSIAMRRIGEPDEIAEVVVFLLSDAASYMTGAHVVVDGGRTACAWPS